MKKWEKSIGNTPFARCTRCIFLKWMYVLVYFTRSEYFFLHETLCILSIVKDYIIWYYNSVVNRLSLVFLSIPLQISLCLWMFFIFEKKWWNKYLKRTDCSAHLKMAGSTYTPSPPLIRPKPYSLQTDIDFTLWIYSIIDRSPSYRSCFRFVFYAMRCVNSRINYSPHIRTAARPMF